MRRLGLRLALALALLAIGALETPPVLAPETSVWELIAGEQAPTTARLAEQLSGTSGPLPFGTAR